MKKQERNALIIALLVMIVAAGIAAAGSQRSIAVAGFPLFAITIAAAFIINWIAFIPAYFLQTEKFFDLVGSLTYISVTLLALLASPNRDSRSYLVTLLVLTWALRLGTFLFKRIQRAGKDDRFDELKPSFTRFLNVWTLQGLWVTLTLSAVLIIITSQEREPLSLLAVIGTLIWILGFGIEVISDNQKKVFRENPTNSGKFINTGLWSRSRHPNYFGEIILWTGILIIALPILSGWSWIALISPVFVILLLTRISGIPMLEEKADKKWGGQPDYESYKKTTPVLIPKLWE